ncbi:hypothetical protein NAH03_21800 [Stenotrophomonas maltophilia]|nr:hypothetical protein [Stenotrophomonas maltophilia]
MFGATVLVPILFHINPATVLLFNGIGTLLYLFICKGKIPAYLGSSFAFISSVLLLFPLRYDVALGGFIMCGVLFCLVSFIVKKAGTGWLDVMFPPAAMGAIVAVIGLELAGVAANMAGLLPADGQSPDSKTIITVSFTPLPAPQTKQDILRRLFLYKKKKNIPPKNPITKKALSNRRFNISAGKYPPLAAQYFKEIGAMINNQGQ